MNINEYKVLTERAIKKLGPLFTEKERMALEYFRFLVERKDITKDDPHNPK